jgi:hypothetical protein
MFYAKFLAICHNILKFVPVNIEALLSQVIVKSKQAHPPPCGYQAKWLKSMSIEKQWCPVIIVVMMDMLLICWIICGGHCCGQGNRSCCCCDIAFP